MEISSAEIIAMLVQLLALSLVLERAFHFIFHFRFAPENEGRSKPLSKVKDNALTINILLKEF